MKKAWQIVCWFLRSKLGYCPKCMRIAFLAAFCAVIVAAGIFQVIADPLVRATAGLMAASIFGLWISHLLAFALRAGRDATHGGQTSAAVFADDARRRFLAVFLRSFVFVAVTTVVGLRATKALAACNCFTNPDCKCPTDFPKCIFNPSLQESICCGQRTIGCAGQTKTWCCPSGYDCSGDEGFCT